MPDQRPAAAGRCYEGDHHAAIAGQTITRRQLGGAGERSPWESRGDVPGAEGQWFGPQALYRTVRQATRGAAGVRDTVSGTRWRVVPGAHARYSGDRKSTRLNSSHLGISY